MNWAQEFGKESQSAGLCYTSPVYLTVPVNIYVSVKSAARNEFPFYNIFVNVRAALRITIMCMRLIAAPPEVPFITREIGDSC